MRAGQLRHKIEIVAPSSARAADGSIENSDVSQGTFYGSVRTDNRSEISNNNKLVSYVRHRITFRYNTTDLTGLVGNAKLILDGTTLHVLSASVKNYRDRMIEVIAEERA